MTELTGHIRTEEGVLRLEQVKAFLRIGHSGEDELLRDLLDQAVLRLEQFSGLALRRRDFLERWSQWPSSLSGRGVLLPFGPVLELRWVHLVSSDTGRQDLSDRFWLKSGRLVLQSRSHLPPVAQHQMIEILYKAGFDTAAGGGAGSGLPADLTQAVLHLCAQSYLGRLEKNHDKEGLPAEVISILQARRGVRL